MQPNSYIDDSDFGSLKNDTQGNTISASIVSGTVFNISNPILAVATLTVGQINAGLRAIGSSSKYAGNTVGTTIYSDFLYSIPSIPGAGIQTGSIYCNLERINSTTVRIVIATDGGSGAPNFKIEENQTLSFLFSTFLSPFD